jgi:hypothetical protein
MLHAFIFIIFYVFETLYVILNNNNGINNFLKNVILPIYSHLTSHLFRNIFQKKKEFKSNNGEIQ